jgi:hypothetical protein
LAGAARLNLQSRKALPGWQSSWQGLLHQHQFIVERIGIFGAQHKSCTQTKNDMQGNISGVYTSKYPFSLIFKTNARSTNYGREVRVLKILELKLEIWFFYFNIYMFDVLQSLYYK